MVRWFRVYRHPLSAGTPSEHTLGISYETPEQALNPSLHIPHNPNFIGVVPVDLDKLVTPPVPMPDDVPNWE